MTLSNIVIAARDLNAMADFYKKLTGWPVFFQNETCCFLGAGKPFLALHSPTGTSEVHPPERAMCLDFEVPDLEAEADRLRQAGLTPESRPNMLVLRDPAGNLVELVKG